MSKNISGKCALCGKECNLSFEHIPPKAAFNSNPVKPVTAETILNHEENAPWDTEGLPYSNQQQGMGLYSLCPECNNNTGSWYGEEYINLTHKIHYVFRNFESTENKLITLKDIYPARIIKQVLSMFCSINTNYSAIEDLKHFVINKESVGIDKSKYKICMYFTKSHVTKYSPLSGLLNIQKAKHDLVSEITAYPLGFIMYFKPSNDLEYEGVDITSFCDYSYDDCGTFQMPLIVLEVNNFLPLDYRTKEEIMQCVEENREWEKQQGM